jgi:hypothetical protein
MAKPFPLPLTSTLVLPLTLTLISTLALVELLTTDPKNEIVRHLVLFLYLFVFMVLVLVFPYAGGLSFSIVYLLGHGEGAEQLFCTSGEVTVAITHGSWCGVFWRRYADCRLHLAPASSCFCFQIQHRNRNVECRMQDEECRMQDEE